MGGATGRPSASANVRTWAISLSELAGGRVWAPSGGAGAAGGGLGGADAALAEDDVAVAMGEDVLGGQQPLLDGGPHAALEEHGLVDLAHLVQEGEVLHVAAGARGG